MNNDEIEACREALSFAGLRNMLEPEPKRGRVNRVLRDHFFKRNELGHWVSKEAHSHYYGGSPSRPHWHVDVLPTLISLLGESYNTEHKIKGSYRSWL